jgi:hypothetical protein
MLTCGCYYYRRHKVTVAQDDGRERVGPLRIATAGLNSINDIVTEKALV